MGNNIITDWAPWQNNFFLSKSELIVDQMYFANYWGPENTKKNTFFKKIIIIVVYVEMGTFFDGYKLLEIYIQFQRSKKLRPKKTCDDICQKFPRLKYVCTKVWRYNYTIDTQVYFDFDLGLFIKYYSRTI